MPGGQYSHAVASAFATCHATVHGEHTEAPAALTKLDGHATQALLEDGA